MSGALEGTVSLIYQSLQFSPTLHLPLLTPFLHLTSKAVASEAFPADAVVGAVGVLALGCRVTMEHVQLTLVLVHAAILHPRRG